MFPILLPLSESLPLIQGRTNPAFSKPCLFLSDTRHFRHFRRSRWSEEPNPCFQWVECKFVIFAVFVKMAPFWQGTRTRFTKNTVCATPIDGWGLHGLTSSAETKHKKDRASLCLMGWLGHEIRVAAPMGDLSGSFGRERKN